MSIKHPSGIDQRIVDKVVARRGRLHAYETIVPTKTALVVVDLDIGTAKRMLEDTTMSIIFTPINRLAASLRATGGVVAWVTTPIKRASENFRAIFGEALTAMYENEGQRNGDASKVWHELDTNAGDIFITKLGPSAFFPLNCSLHEQLQIQGVDTVLIVGAVTNVCCGSSARDAAALGYKVVMVSDALVGQSFGMHEAELATIFRNFGDVRPSEEVVTLLNKNPGSSLTY